MRIIRVKERFRSKDRLIHPLPNGRRVNLLGEEVKILTPGDRGNPPYEITIRPATPEEMEMIYDQGSTVLEEIFINKKGNILDEEE